MTVVVLVNVVVALIWSTPLQKLKKVRRESNPLTLANCLAASPRRRALATSWTTLAPYRAPPPFRGKVLHRASLPPRWWGRFSESPERLFLDGFISPVRKRDVLGAIAHVDFLVAHWDSPADSPVMKRGAARPGSPQTRTGRVDPRECLSTCRSG